MRCTWSNPAYLTFGMVLVPMVAAGVAAQEVVGDVPDPRVGCYQLEYSPPDPMDFRYHLPDTVELSPSRYNGLGYTMEGQVPGRRVLPNIHGGALHHVSNWYPGDGGVQVRWRGGPWGVTLELGESREGGLSGTATWLTYAEIDDSVDVQLERANCPDEEYWRAQRAFWRGPSGGARAWVRLAERLSTEALKSDVWERLREEDQRLSTFGLYMVAPVPPGGRYAVLAWGRTETENSVSEGPEGLLGVFLADSSLAQLEATVGFVPITVWTGALVGMTIAPPSKVLLGGYGRGWIVRIPES